MTTASLRTHAARPGQRPRHRAGTLVRGVSAAVVLLALLFGVPAGLIVVAPLHLPDALPTWTQMGAALTRPDDGRLLLGALALVAWGAWAVFALSVVLEALASLRNVRAPHLPGLGPAQRIAAGLVAAVSLAVVGPALSIASAAAAQPGAVQVLVRPPTAQLVGLVEGSPQPTAHSSAASGRPGRVDPQLKEVTVREGDSLWFLAERHLGAGERYPEIVELNLGRTQPDGRALSDAHWIEPGWHLLMPADAVDLPTDQPSDVSLQTALGGQIVVAPGDTLWDVAAEHLGDGSRYPEIVALNAGVPQPDGDTLTNPDLIRPGWILTLPSAAAGTAMASPAVTTAPDDDVSAVPPRAEAPATEAPSSDQGLDEDLTVGGATSQTPDATTPQLVAPSAAPPEFTPDNTLIADIDDDSSVPIALYLGRAGAALRAHAADPRADRLCTGESRWPQPSGRPPDAADRRDAAVPRPTRPAARRRRPRSDRAVHHQWPAHVVLTDSHPRRRSASRRPRAIRSLPGLGHPRQYRHGHGAGQPGSCRDPPCGRRPAHRGRCPSRADCRADHKQPQPRDCGGS